VENEFKYGRYASEDDDNSDADSESTQETLDTDDDTVSTTEHQQQEENRNEKLGNKMITFWDKRKQKLISDVAVTAWMVSPLPEIREDVKNHIGEHRNAVERVIKKWFSITVRFMLSSGTCLVYSLKCATTCLFPTLGRR
jgi:hypothetical protein